MIASRRIIQALAVLFVFAAAPSCDSIDRARSRLGTTDTLSVLTTSPSGLMLSLQTPGMLARGEEGVLRLSVTNQSDTTARDVRLELIVPGWVEPMPPRPGDREVSMRALEDGGTRFAYGMAETPLAPGETQAIEQRIRVPFPTAAAEPGVAWSRAVRARLLGADGQPTAEVEGEIALDPSVAADTTGGSAQVTAGGGQVGPVRLGMSTTALRQAAPTARDTTWTQEGTAERGAWVSLPGNGRALAVLAGDSVVRLEVRDPVTRTRERVGVGSTYDELRSAYGTACADVGEGSVVVWFANAPGISFALDTPVPANVAQLRANPASIPGTARVTRWWLRRGVSGC